MTYSTPLPLIALLMAAPCALAEPVRVPAEFEPHEATWMQWPFGLETSYIPNFVGIIGAIQDFEPVNILVRNASMESTARLHLENAGVSLDNVTFVVQSYDWAWMRDNGPVWVEVDGEIVVQDWAFDGWGGISPPTNLDDAVPCNVAEALELECIDHSDLIVERGSFEFNGVDTVIASWPVQSDRNPGWSMLAQEQRFREAWGVTDVIWLLSAPEEDEFTGGHVDGIARFIDEDTVVVAHTQPGHVDERVYDDAADILENAGLEVLRLEIPGAVMYQGIQMSANYINWLVVNGAVIVTGFGHPQWDQDARDRIQSFFPDRQIEVVETLEIWYWGGGVHCVTNDQPSFIQSCAGDLNADAIVNAIDLADLLSTWGVCAASCAADFNNDGVVNGEDLVFILANWSGC